MEHDIRLEDIGWKVLKERQVSIAKYTKRALRSAHEAHGAVALLDLALGTGRHLMETLRKMPEIEVHPHFRDADEAHLESGQQLANQLGITHAQFALGDAFDEQELAKITPAPHVVLAAGLFELTSDNNRVLSTLRGLHSCMQPGGFVIYTDQPHHPHLEMIGRVAVQREESPWAMRRRPAEEMDGLVQQAGFATVERSADEHGLFTVGLLERS